MWTTHDGKTYIYFLVTNVFSVSKLILWHPNKIMSSIDLATRFKIGMNLLNSEISVFNKSVTNAFPRSTDIIQVVNELPTDKRHIRTSYRL